ncbi:MAG: oligosaccharide flippase family protein [Betaproteobacteria bacterium]|nr:oligosaccharide flippase family protein [Betaproteobacteria bacterium]MCC6247440.1 oligosaccharide flippase family protein [Rubrivivax sp.]MCL4695869.1 oligosaccharide flippase family protein [Burkholderiaceae bacterium]
MASTSLQASAIWRFTEAIGGEAISFIVFTMLARLLVPADFGAVALAASILALFQLLLYHGALESLIQLPNYEPRHFQAATAANVALALVLVVVGAALAWPLGWVLGRSQFVVILLALLPMLLLRAVMSPLLAVLRRQMNFRAIALRSVVAVFSGGAVAIALAAGGAEAWALVAQQWTTELVGTLMLIKSSPLKPWQMRWDRRSLDELRPVALPVTGAHFAAGTARRLDIFAVGLHLGNATVGVYFMVARLIFAMQMLSLNGLGEIAMVVMSRLRPLLAQPWPETSAVLRLAAWPTCLLFGLMALVGPRLVPIVFGPAWQPAALPMAVYAALSPAGALVSLIGVSLVSAGNATAFQRLSITLAFAQLGAIFVAAPWGLIAVVSAIGATQVVGLPYALSTLRRTEGVSWRQVLARLGPVGAGYAACVVPCGAAILWRPEWVWAAGVMFALASAAWGFVMLRGDWRLVTSALARAKPER